MYSFRLSQKIKPLLSEAAAILMQPECRKQGASEKEAWRKHASVWAGRGTYGGLVKV